MSLYRLDVDEPQLDAPVLVAALEGWVDSGSAGTTAAAQLAEGGTRIATFDPDAIYDYRARRPILDIVDGKPMSLAWADSSLDVPRVEVPCTICRWRLVRSTTSKSTIPMVPTPAAAR